MVGTKVIEEVVGNGMYFDQLDNLLDFQNDDVEGEGNWDCEAFDIDAFPPVWLEESPALSSATRSNHSSDLSPGHRTARYEDIVQLEWLSNFVQDSLSKPKTPLTPHAKRARSKRPRPATFNPRSSLHLIQQPFQLKKKQKTEVPSPDTATVKKCAHCEITKTPQWRMGPHGLKTLCNACGVRYKSGRLFPEYRPAASPTFVPSLHSNSHKKIIEMRKSKNGDGAARVVKPDLLEEDSSLEIRKCTTSMFVEVPVMMEGGTTCLSNIAPRPT